MRPVVARVAGLALHVVVAIALSATGCCTSARLAGEMRAELAEGNRQRAEHAMARAAAAIDAELLPIIPRRIGLPAPCASSVLPVSPEPGCTAWESDGGLAFRFIDKHGAILAGVRVRSPAWYYARLARRGSTLIVLVPKVSHRVVSRETQCECRGSYRDLRDDSESVFFVGDLPIARVDEIEVSIAEDFIQWHCATVVVNG